MQQIDTHLQTHRKMSNRFKPERIDNISRQKGNDTNKPAGSRVLPTPKNTQEQDERTRQPIMSGNGHPTEWISAWVDYKIQPLMLKLPTFLKDTTDLLQHLANIKPTANTRIISLDVTSLYTNIPQRLGINSMRTVGAALDPDADYTTVADLAQLVLENNIFKFNGAHYIQTQGTAMAPAYANIFMYTIEEKIIEQLPEIILWRRFIDDII